MTLLSTEDKARIAATITEVERQTSAEIVVVVVPRSDRYLLPRTIFSVALALGTMLALHWIFPFRSVDALLLLQVPLGAVFFLLFGISKLPVLLASDQAEKEAVHREAMLAFLQKGVTETKNRTGILIYVSEAERRVEIIADRGIHEKVGATGWATHVDSIVAAIHKGTAADGLCHAITTMGTEVKHAFPFSADDVNELSNEVQ